jgi:hypothetical protein
MKRGRMIKSKDSNDIGNIRNRVSQLKGFDDSRASDNSSDDGTPRSTEKHTPELLKHEMQ